MLADSLDTLRLALADLRRTRVYAELVDWAFLVALFASVVVILVLVDHMRGLV